MQNLKLNHSQLQPFNFCYNYFRLRTRIVLIQLWEQHQKKQKKLDKKNSSLEQIHEVEDSTCNISDVQTHQKELQDYPQIKTPLTCHQESVIIIIKNNPQLHEQEIAGRKIESCLMPDLDSKSIIKKDSNSQKNECVSTNIGNEQNPIQNQSESPLKIKSQIIPQKNDEHPQTNKKSTSLIDIKDKNIDLNNEKQIKQYENDLVKEPMIVKSEKSDSQISVHFAQAYQENEERNHSQIVTYSAQENEYKQKLTKSQLFWLAEESQNQQSSVNYEQQYFRQFQIYQIDNMISQQQTRIQRVEDIQQIIQNQTFSNQQSNYINNQLPEQQYQQSYHIQLSYQPYLSEYNEENLINIQQCHNILQVVSRNSQIILAQIQNQQIDQQCNLSNISSIQHSKDQSQSYTSTIQQYFNTSQCQFSQSAFYDSKFDNLDDPISFIFKDHKTHSNSFKHSIKQVIGAHWLQGFDWSNNNNFNFDNIQDIMHIVDVKVSESKHLVIVSTRISDISERDEGDKEILYYYNQDTFSLLSQRKFDINATIDEKERNFDFSLLRQDLQSFKISKITPRFGTIIRKNSRQLMKNYPDQFCDKTKSLSIINCQFYQIYPNF